MGCAPSAFDLAVQSSQSMKKNLAQYSLLQLSDSDLRKLFEIFHGIDENNGDTVVLVQVLAHVNLPHKGFTAKIFSAFNDNQTGTIDFNEFVHALWNFCTLSKGMLDTFVFDLYDKDSTGELSSSQVLGILEDLFGKSESKTNADIKPVTTELQDFERRKVIFNLDRFRSFTKKHQVMLRPVLQAMEILRTKTLGVTVWDRMTEKRMKLSNGRYLSVRKFIAAQGNAKPYTSLSTPGQSRDDESYHQDLSREKENRDVPRQSVAINISNTTTSFEFGDTIEEENPCMTTSTKPSSTPGLTDSAKVRWTASLQSLVTAVSAKTTRRSKSKVHASPKSFGSSSGSGTHRNKSKSRNNSNSADVDHNLSARASPVPMAITSTSTTSSVTNLNPDASARRRSVTFGETTDGNHVASSVATTADASTPKNNSAGLPPKHKDLSPRPAGAHASGNSPTISPTNATSVRSSSSSQRRGSKEVVIWSNDSQSTQTAQQTNMSPKSPGISPKNTNANKNHNVNGQGSNASTPASTARAGAMSDIKDTPIMLFNDKMAFVPHDDAALAVRSRPAARRSVILPGAVEDAQGLTEYMNLHQKCRSLD